MDRFHAGFLKSIGLIKDYLPHLVIAGGWAPFVYYRYLVGDTAKNPIRTADLDIVVGNRLPQVGEKLLDEILTGAGLQTVYKTRSQPPVVHYEKAHRCQVLICDFVDSRSTTGAGRSTISYCSGLDLERKPSALCFFARRKICNESATVS
jgi:hypothetical protein